MDNVNLEIIGEMLECEGLEKKITTAKFIPTPKDSNVYYIRCINRLAGF